MWGTPVRRTYPQTPRAPDTRTRPPFPTEGTDSRPSETVPDPPRIRRNQRGRRGSSRGENSPKPGRGRTASGASMEMEVRTVAAAGAGGGERGRQGGVPGSSGSPRHPQVPRSFGPPPLPSGTRDRDADTLVVLGPGQGLWTPTQTPTPHSRILSHTDDPVDTGT